MEPMGCNQKEVGNIMQPIVSVGLSGPLITTLKGFNSLPPPIHTIYDIHLIRFNVVQVNSRGDPLKRFGDTRNLIRNVVVPLPPFTSNCQKGQSCQKKLKKKKMFSKLKINKQS